MRLHSALLAALVGSACHPSMIIGAVDAAVAQDGFFFAEGNCPASTVTSAAGFLSSVANPSAGGIAPDRCNYAFDAPNDQLLVYLPGSASTTDQFDNFAATAQAAGYKVLVLDYDNRQTVASACQATDGSDQAPSCFDLVREETVTGADKWPTAGCQNCVDLQIDSANSILTRLQHAITYAATRDSSWSHFLDATSGQVANWQDVVLAGDADGGGFAAYLAKEKFTVRAVLMFSAPNDAYKSPSTKVGAWIDDATIKTPMVNFSGLGNFRDASAISATTIWGPSHFKMACSGCIDAPPTGVDPTATVLYVDHLTSSCDGGGSLISASDAPTRLLTKFQPAASYDVTCSTGAAGSVVVDACTPDEKGDVLSHASCKLDGSAPESCMFYPIWQYLLGGVALCATQ